MSLLLHVFGVMWGPWGLEIKWPVGDAKSRRLESERIWMASDWDGTASMEASRFGSDPVFWMASAAEKFLKVKRRDCWLFLQSFWLLWETSETFPEQTGK